MRKTKFESSAPGRGYTRPWGRAIKNFPLESRKYPFYDRKFLCLAHALRRDTHLFSIPYLPFTNPTGIKIYPWNSKTIYLGVSLSGLKCYRRLLKKV